MFILGSLDLIKTVDAPTSIHSASLHPDKDFFVAGGDDFKLYKYDYTTKEEMGKYCKFNIGVAYTLADPEYQSHKSVYRVGLLTRLRNKENFHNLVLMFRLS